MINYVQYSRTLEYKILFTFNQLRDIYKTD